MKYIGIGMICFLIYSCGEDANPDSEILTDALTEVPSEATKPEEAKEETVLAPEFSKVIYSDSEGPVLDGWDEISLNLTKKNCSNVGISEGAGVYGSESYCHCMINRAAKLASYDYFYINENKIWKAFATNGTVDECISIAKDEITTNQILEQSGWTGKNLGDELTLCKANEAREMYLDELERAYFCSCLITDNMRRKYKYSSITSENKQTIIDGFKDDETFDSCLRYATIKTL